MPIRVIIDTDPGVDDALALLLALRSPELDIVAMTTVCGNVPEEQAIRNLFTTLQVAGTPQALRIGRGAARPLLRPLQTATQVHGADGLGDLSRFRNPDGTRRYPEPLVPRALPTAQEVWTQVLRHYPDELTLITLGPLTNLAWALEMESVPVDRFRSIICMGGAITVPGNVTPAAEFNVFVDPHAAQRVFQSRLPITLIPLDVTTQVGLHREAIQALTAESDDPVLQFVRDTAESALEFAEKLQGQPVLHLHDPLAVGVGIDPALVEVVPLHVEVETEGQVARGMTVADRRPIRDALKAPPNLQAALKVDAARFLALFQERLGQKSRSSL